MRKLIRRALMVLAVAGMLAVILVPDWCENLPDWLRSILCGECPSGNCSGADFYPSKLEPGGGRGNLPVGHIARR